MRRIQILALISMNERAEARKKIPKKKRVGKEIKSKYLFLGGSCLDTEMGKDLCLLRKVPREGKQNNHDEFS
jgi:hypothetical protein